MSEEKHEYNVILDLHNIVKSDTYQIYFDTDKIFNDVLLAEKNEAKKYKNEIIGNNNKDNPELLIFLKEYNNYNKIDNIYKSVDILLYMIDFFKNYNFKFVLYSYYLDIFLNDASDNYIGFSDKVVLYLNDENHKNTPEYTIFLDKFKYLLFIKYLSITILESIISCCNKNFLIKFKKNIMFEIYDLYDKLDYNIFHDNTYSKFNVYDNIYKITHSEYYYNTYLMNNLNCTYKENDSKPINIFQTSQFTKFLNLSILCTLYLKNIDDSGRDNLNKTCPQISEYCQCIGPGILYIESEKYKCKLIYLFLYYKYDIHYIIKNINVIISDKTYREYFLKLFTNLFDNKELSIDTKYAIGISLYSIYDINIFKSSTIPQNTSMLYYNMYHIVKKNINILNFNNKNNMIQIFDNYKLLNDKIINFNKINKFITSFFVNFIHNNMIIKQTNKFEKNMISDNIIVLHKTIKDSQLFLPTNYTNMHFILNSNIILELKQHASYNDIIKMYTDNNLLSTIEYCSFIKNITVDYDAIHKLNLMAIVKYFIKICVPKILNGEITNIIELAISDIK